jgi:hypothetical protein
MLEKIANNDEIDNNIVNDLLLNKTSERIKRSQTEDYIKNIIYYQSSIHELSKLSVYFPNNLWLKSFNNKTNDYQYDYTNNATNKFETGSSSLFNSKLDSSLRTDLMKNSGFIGLWLNMQKTFCDESPIPKPQTTTTSTTTTSSTEKNNNNKTSTLIDDISNSLDLTNYQFKTISLLFHLLYSNPMIVFSPNISMIQNLIKKSNQTFMLLDQINKFSQDWLDNSQFKSPKIVKYLEKNETRTKITHLNDLKDDFSLISNRYQNSPSIKIDNLIDDINTINSIAC